MPDIGKKIRFKREQLNMTQEELAKRLGYKSKTTIAKIENGTNDIVQSKVVDFANALNTTVAYLMGCEDDAKKEWEPKLTAKDERDIRKDLDDILNSLDSDTGLMFDGEAIDDETKELLAASLEHAIRTAKITAKKKFTPKKYRKD